MNNFQSVWITFLVLFSSCNPNIGEQAIEPELPETKIEKSPLNYLVDSAYFDSISIDKSGTIQWVLKKNDSLNGFSIEEFRWNKWQEIDRIENNSSNFYQLNLDTSCGFIH